tara:strand:- start:2727 stop:3047 length:321 start_codon:yes stop_codon:yes gene_type:complete
MSKFPLYDDLNKQITINKLENIDLQIEEKKKFISDIKKLDSYSQELFYTLIRYYQMNNHDGIQSINLPFNAKKLKSGYKFDLDNFPDHLKQMLYLFIKKNKESYRN